MAARSKPLKQPPPEIVVIDTNVLIDFKSKVDINDQWELLLRMHDLVTAGALTFPRQVPKELTGGAYPDAPGAWIARAKNHTRHPDPSWDSLADVLATAPAMVDADARNDREYADPYVVALAYELCARYTGSRVAVATNDRIDRGSHTSVATACGLLSIDCWPTESFIAWVETGVAPTSAPTSTP